MPISGFIPIRFLSVSPAPNPNHILTKKKSDINKHAVQRVKQ